MKKQAYYQVYQSTDAGGAELAEPRLLSTHRSLAAAVRHAHRHGIFRRGDDAEFIVNYKKHGHGWGTWIATDGATIQSNVEF